MNSFSILLLLGIGTLVAFLLLVAEVRYFMRYKEFQTVREKMNHADSWKEFVFWHREYLALLWSLLPGISAARVKEIRQSRSRRRSNGREKKSDGFASMLAPSLLGICVCVVCLIGGTYAWFTATKTVSVQSIQMASYNVVTTVKASDGTEQNATSTDKNSCTFNLSTGSYTITLEANGNVSTGYCILSLNNDKTIVTPQIKPDASMTFTIILNEPAKLLVEPVWDSYSGTAERYSEATYTYGDGSSGAKASDEVVPEPSVSPVQTTPTQTENTGSGSESGNTGNSNTGGQGEPITVIKTEETYTVEQGDTLEAIAAKYNTTVEKLMELNNLTEESEIQVGQVLKIPVS